MLCYQDTLGGIRYGLKRPCLASSPAGVLSGWIMMVFMVSAPPPLRTENATRALFRYTEFCCAMRHCWSKV